MSDSPPPSGSEPVTRDALGAMVARATACLPQQGPIGVFVAQNPLQSLESIRFDEAAVLAWRPPISMPSSTTSTGMSPPRPSAVGG